MPASRLSPGVATAFTGYVVLGVAGLLLLRANLSTAAQLVRSGDLSQRPVLLAGVGALSYAASFVLWLVVLAQTPLSIAYPLAVGSTLALSSLGAWLLLDEALTVRLLIGTVMIFAGTALVATR